MALTTDFRITVLNELYDVTAKSEWPVDIEETLGQPSTASFRLQDRVMADVDFEDLAGGGIDLAELDTKIFLLGAEVPLFRGKVLRPGVELPVAHPFRIHGISCTDYQREVFDRRLVGAPGGGIWAPANSDNNFIPIDPTAIFASGSDKGAVQTLFENYATVPSDPMDVDTFVNEYATLDGAPYLADKAKVRQVLEWLAGLVAGNLQYWLDPALRMHWQVIPRWFEQESDEDSLVMLFPETAFPMEAAPVAIDNENPDGVTSVGCRNLGWDFDYGPLLRQFYVVGGVGFAYNGGVVDKRGSGWVSFGTDASAQNISQAQEVLDAPEAVDLTTKLAAAGRASHAVTRGILRGHLTVGNERHHPDGFHVGQSIRINDARMPGYLRNRYYCIQRVKTRLIPFTNWRIYDIDWGDAPVQRASSRRPLVVNSADVRGPGRVYDIAGRVGSPVAGSTVTIVGQLTDDAGNPRRAYGITVQLELHAWDSAGDVVDPDDVGASISEEEVTTNEMGTWEVQMTVGGSGYYCVCPVGSGSCVLKLIT